MTFKKDTHQETIIYMVLWGFLFIAPILMLYIRMVNNASLTFSWSEIWMVWRQCGIFFAFFLIHNYLLAPLLVYQHRWSLYTGICIAFIVSFALYECNTGPERDDSPRHEMMKEHRPPMDEWQEMDGNSREAEGMDRPPRPPFMDDEHGPQRHDGKGGPDGKLPPLIIGQHDVVAVILLILMIFANLGVKLYFKQRYDQQCMAELERKNLEQQLEYLKYQLNPHFLMNTLNNIHALVDINPEQSKQAIIQLSKILRYVLYESNHDRVPLRQEKEFMENYTDLMRIRYGDKLQFTVKTPDDSTGFSIAPLLLISFVENAFKHGVSYQEPSFIDINAKCYKGKNDQNRFLWNCRNSKHNKQESTSIPKQGGVGMVNVRRRLDLIYGDDYTLGINDAKDTYEVILDIPV